MPFRVLVVDDVEANRLLLAEILSGEGYDVMVADCGEAALRVVIAETPDLVLLDVMMPDLSGVEVCRRIRDLPVARDIAVILVTALADRGSRLAGFEADADDYLTKPIDGTELRLRVRTMARLRRYRNLLEERSRAAMLTEWSPDAVLLCGGDGSIVEANPAARALFAAASPIDGKVITDVVPAVTADDRDWLAGADPTVAGAPRVMPIGHDGGRRVIEVSRSVHRWGDRDLAIVVARDVTELDRLRAMTDRLRRHEAIATAATGIAHDFRNYLTAIQMGLDILGCELPATVLAGRDTIRDIQAQIDVGVSLTHRITSVGRGMAAPQPDEDLDLQAMLSELAPLMRHWAGGAELILDLEPSVAVRASRGDVVQIVSNLVVNASQAVGDDGRIVVRTRLVAAAAAAVTLLEVSDNGCGMDSSTLDRIFDAYFSTKTARGGTGLGLATVHDIVTRCGARVEVESAPGVGTTFRVAWPGVGSGR